MLVLQEVPDSHGEHAFEAVSFDEQPYSTADLLTFAGEVPENIAPLVELMALTDTQIEPVLQEQQVPAPDQQTQDRLLAHKYRRMARLAAHGLGGGEGSEDVITPHKFAKEGSKMTPEELREMQVIITKGKLAAEHLAELGEAAQSPLFADLRRNAAAKDRVQEAFVQANEGLVRQVVNRYHSKWMDNPQAYDEILQGGREGLLQAMERFDPQMGFKFSVYATVRIRYHAFDAARGVRQGLRLSHGDENLLWSANSDRRDMNPDVEADRQKLVLATNVVALDAGLQEDSDASDLYDIFLTTEEDTVSDTACVRVLSTSLLDRLPEHQRQIVATRFGLYRVATDTDPGGKYVMHEIRSRAETAHILGLTEGSVRGQYDQAMKTLRRLANQEDEYA